MPSAHRAAMRQLFDHHIVRFLLVGAVNTGFSYSIYSALLYIGWPYAAANFGSLVLGIIFSFHTQGAFVFKNRDRSLIFRFAGCWLVIYVINTGLIAMFISFGLNAYAAGAVAMIPVTLMSYLVQKYLVFGAARAVDTSHSA